MVQIILHVDMDAFFAAVEMRDDPTLRGKPLIIGSLPQERGVVSTCSYEARKYGVHSAMNIKEAYRLCPNGIYMHPNIEKYKAISHRLHEIWNSYATALEAIAFDEAYLDVTERAKDFDSARKIGLEIKRRTRDELKLSCSVGVAYSKIAAKIASEEKKPNGYFEIHSQKDFVKLINDRDVRVLYTVGAMTAERLYANGIQKVRDISEHKEEVIRLLGKQGEWITQLALGIDERKVKPYRPEDAKSIGREITFQEDVDDIELLKDVLLLLALCVDRRAKRVGLHGKGVTLKLTYSDMKPRSKSRSVFETDTPVTIYDTATALLEQMEKQPVRLIGVSIYQLSREGERQIRLDDIIEDATKQKQTRLSTMLGDLQNRYGLDFAAHLEELFQMDTLHKTIEYMRKHRQ